MIKFEDNYFFLETDNTSYIMKIDTAGYLNHSYYGKKILARPTMSAPDRFYCQMLWDNDGRTLDEVPQECPTYGHADLRKPLINVCGKICVFKYKSHEIFPGKRDISPLPSSYDPTGGAETLEITLSDATNEIDVVLSYTVFSKNDVIVRRTDVVNNSGGEIILDTVNSLCLDFEHSDFSETHFSGRWGAEREKVTSKVFRGDIEISNARGGSGHFMNPFLMLHSPDASEDFGDVYSFSLVYSGDHSTVISTDQRFRTRVLQGINPFQFEWKLKSGERFTSPESVLSFSHLGFGGMSRNLHAFIRENIVRGEWKNKERPILINNWEATYMNFDEEKILSIASLAKKCGIELFVLDDGWFGKRNNDNCSLGDWYVNKEKLPSGITGLAEKIEGMGMMFGLWFEPEMVSPDSDLYRAHPDWAIHSSSHAPVLSRNQLVLDLSKKEVQDYIISSVLSVLESAKISYVKWDYNRNIADMPYKGYNYAYTLGMYRVTKEITSRAPHVLFEGCSAGGGRFDLGILCYMPQIWTSDNTDPVERLYIQYGTSFAYPPSAMGSHVTASPNEYTRRVTTLKTRGDVALSGNFGYELDITKLFESELETIKAQTDFCRKIRRLNLSGDFYRLSDPFCTNICAWELVSGDKSEAFAVAARILFKSNVYFPIMRLKGLEEGALYRDDDGVLYSADELMHKGLYLDFPHGDFVTYSLHLKKI